MQAIEKIEKRNKLGVIYKITLGSKFIIGSTINYLQRVNYHKYCLKNGSHCNKPLQNLYNSQSYNCLSFEILQENIPEIILEYVEDVWIGALCSKVQDHNKGLNIIDGSRIVYTEELRNSRRLSLKKRMENLSKQDKDELYKKVQYSRKLKIKEISKNISYSRKKNAKFDWDNLQTKPIIQETKDGKFIKLWASAYQAQKEEGYKASNISAVCYKRYGQKSYKGFNWKFAKENAKNRASKKPK